MGIVFLDNECFDLEKNLEQTGKYLPVSAANARRLCSVLDANNNYTYLTIKSPTGNEIVKVNCVDGEIVIQRAQGETRAQAFSKGRCACFVVNKPVLDDYFEEVKNGGCKPNVVSGNEDYIAVTHNEETCTFSVNMSEKFMDAFENCCGFDDCDPCVLPDGVYENSTITIRGGRVCAVSNGKNIVYTGGSCCGCGDNEETTP